MVKMLVPTVSIIRMCHCSRTWTRHRTLLLISLPAWRISPPSPLPSFGDITVWGGRYNYTVPVSSTQGHMLLPCIRLTAWKSINSDYSTHIVHCRPRLQMGYSRAFSRYVGKIALVLIIPPSDSLLEDVKSIQAGIIYLVEWKNV